MASPQRIDVLDHGFVVLRNLAGPTRRVDQAFDADDTDPANVARNSFDQLDGGRPREADLKLAKYLMANWHTSPFEMIECWFEMKLPIFVARQFVRHRTTVLNEVSGRYVQLPAEWYIPKAEHVGTRPANVKQGRTFDPDVEASDDALWFRDELNVTCARSYRSYQEALARGVPPELARTFLHLNHYTHWVWKQNLHNLFHFMALRSDSHAQYEAQCYSQAVDKLLRVQLPHSMQLFDEYRRKG